MKLLKLIGLIAAMSRPEDDSMDYAMTLLVSYLAGIIAGKRHLQ